MMHRNDFYGPYSPPFSPPERKFHDPYLYVLICQTALCLLLLLCGRAFQSAQPVLWETAKTEYEQLLMSPESVKDWLHDIAQKAPGFFSGFLQEQRLPENEITDEPQNPAPEKESPAEAEASGTEAPGAPSPDSMTAGSMPAAIVIGPGMGGSGTPENCSFAPVLLTAALEPPISGPVTSVYGWRTHPITEKKDFHRGIDIAAPQGKTIHAVWPGIVTETGESAIYGNFVRLDHGHGLQTAYSHCDRIAVKEGENVRKGEVVAVVGSTGVSTGPHVHFELLVNGTYYNPAWAMDGLTGYGD